ncbi:MAG: DUF4363 family protein [Oscillospiraceae bacterium]|nr:DUF4363 family protein [Oscillospiraceae bacterium]
MMRLYISIGLIFLSVSLCLFGYFFSLHKIDEQLAAINEVINEIDSNGGEIAEKTAKAYENWEKTRVCLAFFLEHKNLREARTKLLVCKSLAENGDFELLKLRCEDALSFIDTLKINEKLGLDNIF